MDDFKCKKLKVYNFSCDNCERQFNYLKNLRYHKKHDHQEILSEVKDNRFSSSAKQCPLCDHSNKKEYLLNHLIATHNINLEIENLEFKSIPEFETWKINMEKSTKCTYLKYGQPKHIENHKLYKSYVCHRSGFYVPEGKGLRCLKTQGSKKINAFCPAEIKVKYSETGNVEIRFVKTHVGHQNELGHLFLTADEKLNLASKIAAKVPFDTILNGIRDNISNKYLERLHLLTKKDLHNIEAMYNLTSSKHTNDAISVDAWVIEEKHKNNPCVLYYKPQGVDDSKHPELKGCDFSLIIMNEAQADLLKKYGHDCVCIDGTHNMNSYNFELITLLVLDDMRQGFPCAFFISNRSDEYAISIFLNYIAEKTGKISPNIFMSDMANSFYNAWCSTMNTPKIRLFCAWHVDKCWRKNLSKIKIKEKQIETYKILRTLLEEKEIFTFEKLIEAAVKYLTADADISTFAEYFIENYSKNTKSWAYCHRLHCGINTNMHLERLHKTLKYIYLNGKTVKRLDKTISALMSFIRDKLIDQLIIIHKGKLVSKLTNIRKRHNTSLELDLDTVVKNQDNWTVLSMTSVKEIYTIVENKLNCTCLLVCKECNSCIHKYSCTCSDSSIKWNMCKHIHLVCQLQISKVSNLNDDDEHALHIDCNKETAEVETILKTLSEKTTSSLPSSSSHTKNEIVKANFQSVKNRRRIRCV